MLSLSLMSRPYVEYKHRVRIPASMYGEVDALPKDIELISISDSPRVLKIENLFSAEEAQALSYPALCSISGGLAKKRLRLGSLNRW